MLCGVCLSAVRPLHPVAELLWFQGLGLDVLAEASAPGGSHVPGLPLAGLAVCVVFVPAGAGMAGKTKIEWVPVLRSQAHRRRVPRTWNVCQGPLVTVGVRRHLARDGKRRAGRHLDGEIWDGMPCRSPAAEPGDWAARRECSAARAAI